MRFTLPTCARNYPGSSSSPADDGAADLPLRARRRPLPPHRPDPRPVGPGLPARRAARRAARARRRARGRRSTPGQVGRLGYDILRPVPLAPHRIETRTLRPGRNVEQIEAVLLDAGSGDALMRLSAWRLRREELELPPGIGEIDPPPRPPAEGGISLPAFWTEPVAYHAALDWSFVAGDFDEPGPATAWTRLRVPLVAGERALAARAHAGDGRRGQRHQPRARLEGAGCSSTSTSGSTSSGSRRASGWRWTRSPGWVPTGAGLCTSVLSDERGRVGVSTQTLRVTKSR